MLDKSKLIRQNFGLLRASLDFFTSQLVNSDLFEDIKEICSESYKETDEHFIKEIHRGCLSISDFRTYIRNKQLFSFIPIGIIELFVNILVEEMIIIPIDSVLIKGSEKKYLANGSNAHIIQLLTQPDLLYNKILGFPYIAEIYQKSVLKIENIDKKKDSSIGTGFILRATENNKLIVTNKHVLDENVQLNVYDDEDNTINVGIPIIDTKSDLAVIPFEAINDDIPAFTLANSTNILSEIITIGYPSVPMTNFSYQVIHSGEINSYVEDYKKSKLFLFSAKTSSGNSGSPVINKYGTVLGIVTQELFTKGELEQSGKLPYYAAIPSSEIIRFINECILNGRLC